MHIKPVFKFIFISLLVLSLSGCGPTEEREPETDQTEKESITVATWKDFGVDLSETKIAHLIGNTYYMASWEWDLENMLKKNTRIDRTSMWGEGVQNPETLVELDNRQQLITFLTDVQGAVYLLYWEESGEKMSYFLRKVDAGGESVYCEELPGAQEEYGDLEAVSGGIVGLQGEVCLMGRFLSCIMMCLQIQHMWRPPCFSFGNLDSRRVCGIIWRKWSCVFKESEMDKFLQIGGRG